MERKKTVYIAGPITGVPRYWETFNKAAAQLHSLGYTALRPSVLPEGMSKAQYMRICFAMIDSADVVLMLPDWESSQGAQLELQYCRYIDKPAVTLGHRDYPKGAPCPEEVTLAWLAHDLEEAMRCRI